MHEVILEMNTYPQNQLGCASPTRCWKALRGSEKLKLLDLQLKGPMWEVKEMRSRSIVSSQNCYGDLTWARFAGKRANQENYDQTWPHLSLHRAYLTWKYRKRILATVCCHWPSKACNTLNEGLVQRMHEEPFFRWIPAPQKQWKGLRGSEKAESCLTHKWRDLQVAVYAKCDTPNTIGERLGAKICMNPGYFEWGLRVLFRHFS